MCEITIADGNVAVQNAEQFIQQLRNTLYAHNNDGFGLLAVHTNGEQFGFKAFKGPSITDDNEDEFIDWLESQAGAWRIIAHARLATAGGKGFDETHPIKVVEDDCDASFVVHNGVVRGARNKRKKFENNEDREFNTTVDSEVIAHVHDDIPTDIDDAETSDMRGSLNFILTSPDAILIRNEKYQLTDDMRMTCRSDWADDEFDEPSTNSAELAVITPDKECERESVSERNTRSSGSTSNYSRSSSRNTNLYSSAISKRADLTNYTCELTDEELINADVTTKQQNTIIRGNAPRRSKARKNNQTASSLTQHAGIQLKATYVAAKDADEDDKLHIAVKDVYGDDETPLEGARILAYVPNTASRTTEYTKVVYTGEDGRVTFDAPESGSKTYIRLADIPMEHIFFDGDSGNANGSDEVYVVDIEDGSVESTEDGPTTGDKVGITWGTQGRKTPGFDTQSEVVSTLSSGHHAVTLSYEPETDNRGSDWVQIALIEGDEVTGPEMWVPHHRVRVTERDTDLLDDVSEDDIDMEETLRNRREQVEAWELYELPDNRADGWCMRHNSEFTGVCDYCTEDLDADTLLSSDFDDLVPSTDEEIAEIDNRNPHVDDDDVPVSEQENLEWQEETVPGDVQPLNVAAWDIFKSTIPLSGDSGRCTVHDQKFSGLYCDKCMDTFATTELHQMSKTDLQETAKYRAAQYGCPEPGAVNAAE